MAMTESDRSTIVGVFEDQAQADQAVNELHSAGFSDDQISLQVYSASVTDEDSTADEQGTEAEEESAAEMIPSVFKSKSEVSRTIVRVKAEGREQEALAILHLNGANNANIPEALEADLAPILGAETDNTIRQPEQVNDPRSKDSFFDAPGGPDSPGDPEAPIEMGDWDNPTNRNVRPFRERQQN